MQQRIFQALTRIEQTLSGFTDEGASFRAHQVDPLQIVVAQMVGSCIGDRIDGRLAGPEMQDLEVRRDRLARAACIAARDLLAVVDQYRTEKQAPDMIERLFASDSAGGEDAK